MNHLTQEVIDIVEAANKKEAHLEKVERIIASGTSDGVARSYSGPTAGEALRTATYVRDDADDDHGVEVVSIPSFTDRLKVRLESDLDAALAAVTKASDGPFHTEGWQQPPAHELWRKATSGARHAARVSATRAAAALAAFLWDLPDSAMGHAIALLVDLVGDGGPLGLGNGTSARRSPFSRLGSGRRQASDGPCWYAAAEEAFQTCLREVPHDDYPAEKLVIRFDAECGVIFAVKDCDSDNPCHDHRWAIAPTSSEFETIASNVLLASVGALPEGSEANLTKYLRVRDAEVSGNMGQGWFCHVYPAGLTPDQAKVWYEECSAARKAIADTANRW
jgi:hypothetical protein